MIQVNGERFDWQNVMTSDLDLELWVTRTGQSIRLRLEADRMIDLLLTKSVEPTTNAQRVECVVLRGAGFSRNVQGILGTI